MHDLELHRILNRPGREWTDDEIAVCLEWLAEQRWRHLTLFTLRHLGPGVGLEDARESLAVFLSDVLHRVIQSFDPEKGRGFESYLLLCLKRHAQRSRQRLLTRRSHEEPFPRTPEDAPGFELRLEGSGEADPHETLENRDLLERALNRLPNQLATALVSYYLEGRPVAEVATHLGVPEGTVKTWLYRGRRQMRQEIEALAAEPAEPGDDGAEPSGSREKPNSPGESP